MQRLPGKLRKSAVIVCLATLAAFEAASLKFRELGPRLHTLARFASLTPEEARVRGSGFAFDRRFGEFLESVRRAVPATATVALDAPGDSPLYGYSAAYVLAPRRIVPIQDREEADYAAVFGASRAAGGTDVGDAIRFGSLGRLR